MEFFPTSNQTKILCEPLDFAAFQRKVITYNHDDSYKPGVRSAMKRDFTARVTREKHFRLHSNNNTFSKLYEDTKKDSVDIVESGDCSCRN